MSDSHRITIYDVAAKAGVSIATVSHALNRPQRVKEETRNRILAIIDELDFVPKAQAVQQARRGISRIGVLAPFTSYPSYADRLYGVLEACRGEAIDVVVFDHDSVAASDHPLLNALPTSGRLDGLLIMGIPLDQRMADRLARRKLTTVLVDSFHRDFTTVNVDDEAGGYAIGAHLIGRGHRRFAFVSEDQASTEYVSSGQRRMKGFMRALGDGGVGADAVQWIVTTPAVRGGRAAADELLRDDSPRRATAVFALHDDLAVGMLGRLREVGTRVPEDVAIVGYDGRELAEAVGLTTIQQPLRETGRLGAELLRSSFSSGSRTVQHVQLGVQLVEGTTT